MKNKLKNTILAGLAGISLSACGGGGGGGPAVDDVNNFVGHFGAMGTNTYHSAIPNSR